jgi:hypothetical protein
VPDKVSDCQTYQEALDRVFLLGAGSGGTWDLSDNDVAALAMVLKRLDELEYWFAHAPMQVELAGYVEAQKQWSKKTFGEMRRTKGIVEHIRKELLEIEAAPDDLTEWIDVIILALDGYWRHGGHSSELLYRLLDKQRKNFARQWGDASDPNKATEHIRSIQSGQA